MIKKSSSVSLVDKQTGAQYSLRKKTALLGRRETKQGLKSTVAPVWW